MSGNYKQQSVSLWVISSKRNMEIHVERMPHGER